MIWQTTNWIWGVGGLVCGGAAVGLLVWLMMRRAQAGRQAQMQDRLTHLSAENRRQQDTIGQLAAEQAAAQVLIDQLPALREQLDTLRQEHDRLQETLRKESAALAQAAEKNRLKDRLEKELAEKAIRLDELNEQLARQQAELARLKTELAQERRQSEEKLALLDGARRQLKAEFENLATHIFEENSRKFVEQNRSHVDQLLSPLRQQIGDFRKRVEDVYDKETRDRTALHTEIHHLKELNQRISKEALNLTRALKGDSKAQGNWGEVVLQRVLEASGLEKGREYEVQVSLKDSGGKRFQPDVIIRLPDEKDVVVDAKVSLKAYEQYFSADDPELKQNFLKAHIDSLRQHIRGLSGKHYEDLEGIRSLDFIIMFVPIEAAFMAAVQQDRQLFGEAYEKNIILVSPSTLLVTLKTIHTIWRNEYQNRNALLIAKKAGGLYDKFVGFVDALEEIGRQLDKARDAYRTARDRLSTGRGNLVRRTQELKSLGVKAAKELPAPILEKEQADRSAS